MKTATGNFRQAQRRCAPLDSPSGPPETMGAPSSASELDGISAYRAVPESLNSLARPRQCQPGSQVGIDFDNHPGTGAGRKGQVVGTTTGISAFPSL